ncbi:MAG: hypothetical protein J6N92_03955 [Alloprevotella sp.]|nr:hypothetical protein [Alloprevotella sp.]
MLYELPATGRYMACALPFAPEPRQLIFVSPNAHDLHDAQRMSRMDTLSKTLRGVGIDLVYPPRLIKEVQEDSAARAYFRADAFADSAALINQRLLSLLPTGIIRCPSLVSFRAEWLEVWEIPEGIAPDEAVCQIERLFEQAATLDVVSPCSYEEAEDEEQTTFIQAEKRVKGFASRAVRTMRTERLTADERFDSDVTILLEQAKLTIEKLRRHGIAQWMLEELVREKVKLSRLIVTPSYHIVLPDYDEMEIAMTPLPRAVYLLFLRHQEGIPFSYLPDYFKELYALYEHVSRMADTNAMRRSIEDVTDPLKNSINEKCARIREAFLKRIDDQIARHYYITGKRGEAKRIVLDRDLVEWQPRTP